MREKLNRFKLLINKICQYLLDNKIMIFFRKQLYENPIFLTFIALVISLPLDFYINDIFLDIFAWLYAANENVEISDLSEDYGFGMMGFLFGVSLLFILFLIIYFFIKKQLMRFSHYE